MSAKPENTFTSGVHKFLPPESALHREKMNNPYRSGTADWWYSGSGLGSKDLWIEWKFIKVPVRPDTMIDLVNGKKPDISHLQQDWLMRRYHEGRNVAVIVGCKDGGVIFLRREWEAPISAGAFRLALRSRQQLAAFIQQSVMGSR